MAEGTLNYASIDILLVLVMKDNLVKKKTF